MTKTIKFEAECLKCTFINLLTYNRNLFVTQLNDYDGNSKQVHRELPVFYRQHFAQKEVV